MIELLSYKESDYSCWMHVAMLCYGMKVGPWLINATILNLTCLPGYSHCRLAVLQASSTPSNPQWHTCGIIPYKQKYWQWFLKLANRIKIAKLTYAIFTASMGFSPYGTEICPLKHSTNNIIIQYSTSIIPLIQ